MCSQVYLVVKDYEFTKANANHNSHLTLFLQDNKNDMQFHELTPMLWVPDIKQTVAFYTEVLGFTRDNFSDEWRWASVSRDQVVFMLAAPNEHMPYTGPVFTGSFYLRVDDIDAVWEKLKEKAVVVYPIDNFEYGMREFAIKDNNGFMLQFGQEIPRNQ